MQTSRHLPLIVQSVYVLLIGLQLIFVPNMLLRMFGFDETAEIWIKVLGIVVLSLSVIYYTLIPTLENTIKPTKTRLF